MGAPGTTREECAAEIMRLAQDILKLAPAAGLYVGISIKDAPKRSKVSVHTLEGGL